ncbi:hypothetical protein scyTo_0022356 [Scyliorhinus torazame]|uniref:PID domain-containing protein n=1 Tax=Scyliorhinus torazame TaxID=75743 RepID=A0A401QB18_SCYTO|nr:hypothetical protein [Scyliorhinus torazame]
MGCVEVLQSMRALDFNTRTQVTREAISVVCEAVPGAKGVFRKRKWSGSALKPGLFIERADYKTAAAIPLAQRELQDRDKQVAGDYYRTAQDRAESTGARYH